MRSSILLRLEVSSEPVAIQTSIMSLIAFMAVFATPIARGWLKSLFCIQSKQRKKLRWIPDRLAANP